MKEHLKQLIMKAGNPEDIETLAKSYHILQQCGAFSNDNLLKKLEAKDNLIAELKQKIALNVGGKPAEESTIAPKPIFQNQSDIQDSIEGSAVTASKCFTELLEEADRSTPLTKDVEAKPLTKSQDLFNKIVNLLEYRTKGKKVSAQTRVKKIADDIGCSTTHLMSVIREKLSNKYTLIPGSKLPNNAIHGTATIKGKPFYIVSNSLLGYTHE